MVGVTVYMEGCVVAEDGVPVNAPVEMLNDKPACNEGTPLRVKDVGVEEQLVGITVFGA